MSVRMWLAEPLPHDVADAIDRLARTDDVAHVAVMPDVHLAEDVCIGTVVATRSLLFPSAVGGDIGCGMAAIRFIGGAELLADERVAARILAGLYQRVPTIRHHAPQPLPIELEPALSDLSLDRMKHRDGAVEFATLGRGNHFIEFQTDDQGWLWLMLHSGSRAMGQAIRQHHSRDAPTSETGLRYWPAESAQGQAYLHDLTWALAYADASRRAMVAAIVELVGEVLGIEADESTYLACHHNHVRAEEHSEEQFWVHRKGAISAREGEPGIVPGSMGSESYHVVGRGLPESLTSTSHGAGRALSRTEARRRISVHAFEREVRGVWYDHRIAARLRDEAPSAYKDVRSVMRAQHELTRIVRTLRPVLSYKGA